MAYMQRPRTPQEKKQLEYTKDHDAGAEYPHTFRKSWPQKEAKTRRAYRRKVRQLSTYIQARGEDDFPEDAVPGAIRRKPMRKWGATPVGEIVQYRITKRLSRTAWNFFKWPYNSARDRERFASFLATVVRGRTDGSKRLASLFRRALDNEQYP